MKAFLKGLVFLLIFFASLNLGCFLYMYEKHTVKIGGQEKVVYLFVLKDKVDYYLGPKYQRKFTYIIKDDTTSYFCFPPTHSDFHITYTDYPYFRNVWASASNLNKPDPKSFLKNIVLNNKAIIVKNAVNKQKKFQEQYVNIRNFWLFILRSNCRIYLYIFNCLRNIYCKANIN